MGEAQAAQAQPSGLFEPAASTQGSLHLPLQYKSDPAPVSDSAAPGSICPPLDLLHAATPASAGTDICSLTGAQQPCVKLSFPMLEGT